MFSGLTTSIYELKIQQVVVLYIQHLVAFQEQTENTSLEYIHLPAPKTKSRKTNVNEVTAAIQSVDDKKDSPQFNNQHKPFFTYDTRSYTTNYLLWVILRKQNALDQLIPIYSEWKLQTCSKGTGTAVLKTTDCYLPPTTSKVTDY